jgi:hypothetical protein
MEVRDAEVCSFQVRPAEVRLSEVRFAKVRQDRSILVPPFIPDCYSLLK